MLTQTLRKLADNGLVERRSPAAVPSGAEYLLTELGQTHVGPVTALAQWAEQHAEGLVTAQERRRSK